MSDAPFVPFDRLPGAATALLAPEAVADFFLTEAWFRVLAETALDPGDEPRVYLAGGAAGPRAALVACRRARAKGAFAPRTVSGLANAYSLGFAPVWSGGAAARPAAIEAIVAAATARPRDWDAFDVNTLDRDAPVFADLSAAFRRAGLAVQEYFHFGNWYETTEGRGYNAYLEARPAELRNTLARREAKLKRQEGFSVDIVDGGPDLDAAIADYETVYAASWKRSEPYPRFAAAFVRAAAAQDCLRLGVLKLGGEPAAAQIWIVWKGRATICKLAHDERFKALSVGSVLTAHIMRRVLDRDRPIEVDFGRGDDPYKRLWLPRRRERWGMTAYDPRTPRGLVASIRNIAGRSLVRRIRALRGTGG